MPRIPELTLSMNAVKRLLQEEHTYHRELLNQELHLAELQSQKDVDENHEWNLKQERAAIKETRAMFAVMRGKIEEALRKLEHQHEVEEVNNGDPVELEKAEEIIRNARKILGLSPS